MIRVWFIATWKVSIVYGPFQYPAQGGWQRIFAKQRQMEDNINGTVEVTQLDPH